MGVTVLNLNDSSIKSARNDIPSYIHSPVALVLREREREQVPWNLWITPPRFPRFHGTYGSRNMQMTLFCHILFSGTRKYTGLCPILFPGTAGTRK